MPDWIGLLLVLGFVTVILVVYMLITRSAGIYATSRQFWRALLLSAGMAYVLSGSLFLFFHLSATISVAVSAIVPFLVGNLDLGEKSGEPAPTDAGREMGQPEEDEAGMETLEPGEEEAALAYEALEEHGWEHHADASGPDESGPCWN